MANGEALLLIYAPPGENAGSLTFPVKSMVELAGRPILGAFHQLLEEYRVFTAPAKEALPGLLKKSRDFQAHVSNSLSHQVLEALYELARGFQTADDHAGGTLLGPVIERDPQETYGGLISTMLRLVFLLYAEDRGLMPAGPLYQENYSVHGLFERLREDHERYPDTMDNRYGGWARLLAVFRGVHGGCRHREMKLPARRGHLFDPERFPFLEGRSSGSAGVPPVSGNPGDLAAEASAKAEAADSTETPEHGNTALPRLGDGTLHRILHLLLYLDGERLSYRTLDVEQIGSVYETIMAFHVEKAPGRMIALKPKKRHGAPIHVSLDELLATKPAAREELLLDQADTKLAGTAAKALKDAHNTPLVLSRNKLTAFASDADADAVTLTAVSPASARGGSVVLGPTSVTYTPPNNYSGADSFTLTLTDARGDGKVDVKFQGIPNRNYRIQRSINMTTWENIGQTTASPTGQVTFLDENPPVPNAFYRIARF